MVKGRQKSKRYLMLLLTLNYITVVSLYGGIASLYKHGHISHRSVSNAVLMYSLYIF